MFFLFDVDIEFFFGKMFIKFWYMLFKKEIIVIGYCFFLFFMRRKSFYVVVL